MLGDRYRLLRKVGEGAMGEVFEAEHVLLNRKVAVKLLQRRIAADPEASVRLQREARSTTGLAHPNVVDTIDFGFADGQAFLVMEWLDGENLDARMSRGPLELDTALEIAAQATAGLIAAHERGVIHRDIKPANLFLTRDHRGALLVKVLDFGIAKLALHEPKLTATGVLIGTPNYMAPEQAEGNPIDGRTDVYALGVILYEMLTGTVPFLGETPLAVLHQHTSRLPILPSARAPERGISDALDMVVMRCLAKRPEERFATMHDLAAALAEVRGESVPDARSAAPVVLVEPRAEVARAPAATHGAAPDDALLAMPRPRRSWLAPAGIGGVALVGTAIAFFALRGGAPQGAPADAGAIAMGVHDAAVLGPPPDAAPAAPDAGRVATIDAGTGPAPVTLAIGPGATFEVQGHGFRGTVVARPAVPVAGEVVELTVELSTLEPAYREAAAAGRLGATIEVRYFKDHSLVEESRHELDASARFTVSVRLAHAAKHHAHIDLLLDGKEVDHAKVDLFPDLK